MTDRLATTPFGGGRMTARMFLRQTEVTDRQEAMRNGNGGNDAGQVDKWQLIRALTEARAIYGLSDRTIMLLEALLSFANERTLDGREPIIVFPSNRELALRARGMAPATIRRHLAALVDEGMIFRRDSANGKRFCRRDDHGAIEDAFGFDLAPLALRAGEIYANAEAARLEARKLRQLRGEITVHQRDISKIIEIALEEGRAGGWIGFVGRLAVLRPSLGRQAHISILEVLREDLIRLRSEVENAYLSSLSQQEMSANEHHSERHHQNSNADKNFELSGKENKQMPSEPQSAIAPERKLALSLTRLTKLCPQIIDYAREGIQNWTDLIRTADLVRSMLGVSPDAWAKAKAQMGEAAAAVAIAVILERADMIRSPGGYLRNLTAKAEKGTFSVFPMLQALERKDSTRE